MGIKERDSVESLSEETNTTPDQLPVEQAAPAAASEPAVRLAPRSVNLMALESLLLPLLHAPAAAPTIAEPAAESVAEQVCPVCAGVVSPAPAAETTAPGQADNLGLSSLALAGVLSFLYQTHRRERTKERT